MDSIGDIATVTVHIKKIREKIEPDTAKPQYIETIWGSKNASGSAAPSLSSSILSSHPFLLSLLPSCCICFCLALALAYIYLVLPCPTL